MLKLPFSESILSTNSRFTESWIKRGHMQNACTGYLVNIERMQKLDYLMTKPMKKGLKS